MDIVFTLVFTLAVSSILVFLGKKIKIPTVVSLIICGLLLDIPLISITFIMPNAEALFSLGDFALILLMYLAGLESSWKVLYDQRKTAALISVFAVTIPFLLGFTVFSLLGFSLLISLIVGICMSITAEATTANVLLELRKLRTKVGAAMMGAGILDDIIGLSMFILITYLLKSVNLIEDIFIAGAILSFFIGILVQNYVGRENTIVQYSRSLISWIVIPFFFVSVGLHFDLNSLALNPVLVIIIIAVAITGKLIGTLLTKPFTSFSWKQLYLIGWAMNSRGAVEIVIALIAFRSGLIPPELYSGLIIMALTTTLIFPFIITRMIKADPKIMG